MKKWIKRIIFLIVIALIVGALAFKPEEKKLYRTSNVEKANIETLISGSGPLTASKERKEYGKVSAEVLNVFYEEGDDVNEGDVILELDSSNYLASVKNQEIAIKQSELSKGNIEKQIADLVIRSENDGYVNALSIVTGSYITNSMAICNVVKDNKFEIVSQFTYYENNPILVGSHANISLVDSLTSITGRVTKVSDMRKLISGNAQVIDVTIEVETSGYSLEGARAKVEVSNGVNILQSVGVSSFKSINSNIIRSKSYGTVKSIPVIEGQMIKKGDVIAILDNQDLTTSLQNINLTLENMNNQLEVMKRQLEYYTIKAPITGKIISQKIEVGDMVSIGTVISSIANQEKMEFIIPIDELDIAKLKYEQEVRVTIDAIDETEKNNLSGKIIDIPSEGVTLAGVTDYNVTVEVMGSEDMKISMNANADIVVESVKDVLCVPIDSVIKENGKRFVDVLLDDGITIERKEIVTGAKDLTNIEVKSGLIEGEKVIVPEVSVGISLF